MRTIKLKLCLLTMLMVPGLGQTIQFSLHVSSSIDATKDQDMDFQSVIAGSGLHQINLGDSGMGVFAITGDADLDVLVTVTPPSNLAHTGASSDVIPFTLNFAYANRGANDVNQAVQVVGTSARFPIKARQSGPPGTPPTPRTSAFTATQETAYIYVYGTLNVGNIDAGNYSGTVDLTVTYD